METKKHASFRLSVRAKGLLTDLAKHLGLSRAGVIENLIRDRAEKEGIPKK